MHMIATLRAILSLCLLLPLLLQAQYNISFVGQLSYQQLRNSDLSNLWGYTDEFGNEYAIVGANGTSSSNPGGVSVVDLSDPTDPQEIFFVPGPPSLWREVKVWNDHAYITTEAEDGGITIIDLSPLPQSTELSSTVFFGNGYTTSHSLFIDENGRLFIFGSSRGNGGAIMYDLVQDPMQPEEVGEYDLWYVHDGYARGDTLYAAHIYDGFFSIVDVSDPQAPVLLGTQVTPDVFSHNVWLDDSGQHIFTTDEKTNAYVGAYDISDPTDIQYLDKLRSDNGSGAVPHNTYWRDHFLITSYYTYGVTIYDALRPDNLIEVGHFDTSPFSGGGFDGAWGVYPFFDSELLIISDIEQGLFVLDPTYVRACWLEGTVTNAITTAPVPQATITILGPDVQDLTALDGGYATGYHAAGTYTVEVFAAGYQTATVSGIQLVNGEVTILDVQLVPLSSFAFTGHVSDAFTSAPIEGAQVVVENDVYWFTATTNADGDYTIPALFENTYEITVGQWGWITNCETTQDITPGSNVFNVQLQPGYYDDFALDFGWTVTSSAVSGVWERGVPLGTNYMNEPSNPSADVQDDCGDQAYVTGNGGGGAGDDDVDSGWTLLTSPPFDVSGMIDPHIRFRRWFFNSGGSGAPNDQLRFILTNGTDSTVVESVAGSGHNSWQQSDIRILDHMPLTSTMRFHAFAVDMEPGHLVEAGLDLFQVVEMGSIGIPESITRDGILLWPNPSDGLFHIELDHGGEALVEVFDAVGRRVIPALRMNAGPLSVDAGAITPGTYLVRITPVGDMPRVRRVVVR